jgi:hypothetical protein
MVLKSDTIYDNSKQFKVLLINMAEGLLSAIFFLWFDVSRVFQPFFETDHLY